MTFNSSPARQCSSPCWSLEQCCCGDTGVWRTPTPSTLTIQSTRKPQRTRCTSAGTAPTATCTLRYLHSDATLPSFCKWKDVVLQFCSFRVTFFLQRQMLSMEDMDVAWPKDEEDRWCKHKSTKAISSSAAASQWPPSPSPLIVWLMFLTSSLCRPILMKELKKERGGGVWNICMTK